MYTAEFTVDSSFNEAGAITVLNRHQREFFLESIVVEGFACGPIHFPCNSWVQPSRLHPTKRIFFSNKVGHLSLSPSPPSINHFCHDWEPTTLFHRSLICRRRRRPD